MVVCKDIAEDEAGASLSLVHTSFKVPLLKIVQSQKMSIGMLS